MDVVHDQRLRRPRLALQDTGADTPIVPSASAYDTTPYEQLHQWHQSTHTHDTRLQCANLLALDQELKRKRAEEEQAARRAFLEAAKHHGTIPYPDIELLVDTNALIGLLRKDVLNGSEAYREQLLRERDQRPYLAYVQSLRKILDHRSRGLFEREDQFPREYFATIYRAADESKEHLMEALVQPCPDRATCPAFAFLAAQQQHVGYLLTLNINEGKLFHMDLVATHQYCAKWLPEDPLPGIME